MTGDLLTVPSVGSPAAGGEPATRGNPAPEPARRSVSPHLESSRETATPQRNPSATEAALEEARRRMGEALEKAEARGFLRRTSVRYEFTDDGTMVIKVMDARTDKLVRTIPPEEQLAFARGLEQYFGLLVDRRG